MDDIFATCIMAKLLSTLILVALGENRLTAGIYNNACNSVDDAVFCEQFCQEEFVKCIEICAGDGECSSNCNRESVACEADCPCHENCPNGSPCDVTFLVLNSYYATPKTNLFTWQISGDRRETLKSLEDFYEEGTSADTTCSMTYRGKMYIIGGHPNYGQISVINGCQLTRLDTDLPEPMIYPMCTSYNDDEEAMFCDSTNPLRCYRFTGTGFRPVREPEFYHESGGLTHWNNDPIIIGGLTIQVETFNGTEWNRLEDLPAPDDTYIIFPSAVNFKNDVYVFGGKPDGFHKNGAFKFNGSWTKIQNLSGNRHGHRSIVLGDSIYHIGGKFNERNIAPFEEWKYNNENGQFAVTLSNTKLYDFLLYPETFIVNLADYAECT